MNRVQQTLAWTRGHGSEGQGSFSLPFTPTDSILLWRKEEEEGWSHSFREVFATLGRPLMRWWWSVGGRGTPANEYFTSLDSWWQIAAALHDQGSLVQMVTNEYRMTKMSLTAIRERPARRMISTNILFDDNDSHAATRQRSRDARGGLSLADATTQSANCCSVFEK